MSVCEKHVGGLPFDKLGPARRAEMSRYVGEFDGRRTHRHTQLVGTGRGMLATLLP